MTNTESMLVSIAEAAKIVNVKENTVRVWLSQRKVFPKSLIVRLGRRVLFNRNKFAEWISNGCPQEMEE